MIVIFKFIIKNILLYFLLEINICIGLFKGLIYIVKIEKKGFVKLIFLIVLFFKFYFYLFFRLI